MILHAGLVAAFFAGGWRGALIKGPSGSGKSDLALRCIEARFRLVADDRVLIWRSGDALYGRAPDTLAGRIEVRGLDVLAEPSLAWCRIMLSVESGDPERMPEPAFDNHAGLSIPSLCLPLLESSAPAKLRRALQHLGGGAEGAYQGDLAGGPMLPPGGDSR